MKRPASLVVGILLLVMAISNIYFWKFNKHDMLG